MALTQPRVCLKKNQNNARERIRFGTFGKLFFVIFPLSFIILFYLPTANHEVCNFSNLEDLKAAYEPIAGIGKIVPNGKYYLNTQYDHFKILRIGQIDRTIYVSEEFISKVDEFGLTGLKFIETDLL